MVYLKNIICLVLLNVEVVSVVNLLNYSNVKFKSVENFTDFKNLNKIILLGVGSYKNLMNNLENVDIKNILYDKVCGKKIPF